MEKNSPLFQDILPVKDKMLESKSLSWINSGSDKKSHMLHDIVGSFLMGIGSFASNIVKASLKPGSFNRSSGLMALVQEWTLYI